MTMSDVWKYYDCYNWLYEKPVEQKMRDILEDQFKESPLKDPKGEK